MGGGGSSAGAPTIRGPFSFAYNTAGLAAGVAFYTPTIGDWLLDAWVEVDTAFNGTTPTCDIGQFPGAGTGGLFVCSPVGYGIDLTKQDSSSVNTSGLLVSTAAGLGALTLGAGNVYFSATDDPEYSRIAPGKFVTADPLLLVASQTGFRNATAIDSTAGAAKAYIITATPVAFT